MVKQLALFTLKQGSPSSAGKNIISTPAEIRGKELKDCLKYLLQSSSLWDMRAWRKYKDRKEVGAYVRNPEHKNDGHARYCVERLKELKVPKVKIVEAIMNNPNIQYKYRLVPCFLVDSCPELKSAKGNYSEADCNKCEKKEDKKDGTR